MPNRAPKPIAHLLPSSGRTTQLPHGVALCRCRYSRHGNDLHLTSEFQPTVVLRHFYTVEKAPYLRDREGDVLSGELARLLAGLSDHAVDALMKRSQERANRSG